MRATGIEDRADGAILFHRMAIVVAEVTRATNRKADARMAVARCAAGDIDALAKCAQEAMTDPDDPSMMRGARAARELRQWKPAAKAVRGFADGFAWFRREHGALLSPETLSVIDAFLDWFPARQQALRERAQAFEKAVREDLRADADKNVELARLWSTLDSDPAA